jgi:hypoxanthine phosphoribosyltransferase
VNRFPNVQFATLIDQKQLQKRVQEMGKSLTEKFKEFAQDKDSPVVAICVLKGGFVFFSDLVRAMDLNVQCEFFAVSSYQGEMTSSGEVKVTLDLGYPIENKQVILVEDIVDTGLTMNYLKSYLGARKPKSLTTVALLLKPDSLKVSCAVDLVGFKIKNEFVIGYGLDYQGFYRNLPYIARVESLQ